MDRAGGSGASSKMPDALRRHLELFANLQRCGTAGKEGGPGRPQGRYRSGSTKAFEQSEAGVLTTHRLAVDGALP